MLSHPGVVAGHPAGCGTGDPRPFGTPCTCCQAFPPCLFHTGGGPTDCAAGATPTGADLTACQASIGTTPVPAGTCGSPATVTFDYDSLDDFANVEEVATVLDDYFHGIMHSAVAFGDDGSYVSDVADPSCSPRDPMFWRLHKAIDDVVRAWQDRKPVDVVVVIDRSGSMGDPDSGGGTKLAAALEAARMFASMLPDCDTEPDPSACDEAANRIGLVTYSSTASAPLALTPVDAALVDGAFEDALDDVEAAGASGCTGMGLGIQEALELLCPPGDCEGFSAAGDNDRKAILLLTDGIENVPPCLNPAGAAGGTCGGQCFGAGLDYTALEFTQLVAIGFGAAGSLNGESLTFLAERQGGIYMQNPNAAPEDDLKYFYSMAFGRLTDEFALVDPRGVLAANAAASEPVEYTSCGDDKLTFSSGWQEPAAPGGLRLLVETPAGDLLPAAGPTVERDADPTWEFARAEQATTGTWRAQLVRPHQVYVNGFAPDAFAKLDQGTRIVRRQIQRLCPDGCKRVLFYEQGRRGRSAYAEALRLERAAGLVGAVEAPRRPADLARALVPGRWDLVVYANMGPDRAEPYDDPLARLLCSGQRAVVTETRRSGGEILKCAGVEPDGTRNWERMEGDGLLFAGDAGFANPGHPVATYGLRPSPGTQATANDGRSGAIGGRVPQGREHHWFLNVLGRGLSKLDPHARTSILRTGDDLVATVRILPSYNPAGGYDRVDARVEVEFPRLSVGSLLAEKRLGGERRVNGEVLDPRTAALSGLKIPTGVATFPLFDDGTRGDLHAGNGYWTGRLPGLGQVDGTYRFRFILDLTKDGCTTRRELSQTYVVELGVDPRASRPRVGPPRQRPNGGVTVAVDLRPADRFGNLWGPGRPVQASCTPEKACRIADGGVRDRGDGTYSVLLDLANGVASAELEAFGTSFVLPVACDRCPKLAAVALAAVKAAEHGRTEGTVRLSDAAPAGGAVVYLASSNRDAAYVLDSVTVDAGKSEARFPIWLLHAHDGPASATITATYGDGTASAGLTVTPLPPREKGPVPAGQRKLYPGHRHGGGGMD